MDANLFRTDLEQIPAALTTMADAVEGDELHWPLEPLPRRILLTGMGSSWFAASVMAQRLRARGFDAVAELASAQLAWPPAADLLVVPISASGTSAETLEAAARHAGASRVVALTNTAGSPLGGHADEVVDMRAGPEASGVACRSFRHTIGALAVLESQLVEAPVVAPVLRRAAAATADLLERADAWVPMVVDALSSPDGTWFLAPVERVSSALQGALMVREGPRRRADGCETGDWSHVDVYLTKTLDYRAMVFAGSRYDAPAAAWMAERGATAVAVGGPFLGAAVEIRYPGEDDPLVALLTEVLVAELVAWHWWSITPGEHA